jgi:diaminohydroxyphosphoribosylaminopyrimidine deaminase/5-amino-6-(5-phosphoribosylamino)uracil reductase
VKDEFYIKRALRLAERARGMVSPNPMVGAVIVKNGRIISEDFHRRPGTPHAEALAIGKAGEKARASSLYVNLEPCCHTEKRTPPCTKAIINAGIKKVIISMKDPNPRVSGKGITEIQKAGVEVKTGILEDRAKKLNEAYIKYITTGKPLVILKTAMTLDGKIAHPGPIKVDHRRKAKVSPSLKSSVDAIMTAIGTVKADNPQLTSRIKGGKNPVRIIIDPNLEMPLDAKVLQIPPETIIVTKINNAKSDYLYKSGINMIYYKEKLYLKWLMEKLGKMEIASVLIEGGSSLNAHALEDGVVDKVMFFVAPIIIAGRESFPAIGGKTFKRLEDAYRIKDSA